MESPDPLCAAGAFGCLAADTEGLEDTAWRLAGSFSTAKMPKPAPDSRGASTALVVVSLAPAVSVPLEVPAGVFFGLSARTFRGPDLGVTL